jgi:hypothetical protein
MLSIAQLQKQLALLPISALLTMLLNTAGLLKRIKRLEGCSLASRSHMLQA